MGMGDSASELDPCILNLTCRVKTALSWGQDGSTQRRLLLIRREQLHSGGVRLTLPTPEAGVG